MRGSSQPLTSPSLDQPPQLALAQHGVGQIQPGELDLLRMVDAQLVAGTSRTAADGPRRPDRTASG